MEAIVKIRKYNHETDAQPLEANAAADNHSGVYLPTHVSYIVDADGKEEIVGYVSIAQVPVILTWQHSKKVGPLDSLRLLGFVEGALCNAPMHMFPCDPESPYNRLLPKAGYIQYTKPVKLYIKGAL